VLHHLLCHYICDIYRSKLTNDSDDDVIAGRLYQGKPSDMWALGVLLYTMLYGQFPFYDNTPHELFRKIKAVEYSIPEYVISC